MFEQLMSFMRRRNMLPRISDTEREALEAGTVWIDGDIFSGKPDFERMLAEPYDTLSDEEQAYLDGPTEQLCQMVDPYELARSRKLPDEVLEFIKAEGFMGLIVGKAWGGREFSTLAMSSVMAKVNAHSSPMGTFVTIPNSLGAAELLQHYGTSEQQEYYLPRLARGDYIPCFALTEPGAGSDAASIQAEGTVFAGNNGDPLIRLNFNKRYITLAPVATLISLAFQLRDPDNLLGQGESPGITVAMLERDTPGVTIGDHHVPIGAGFYNGPITGQDVMLDPAMIIGGAEMAGQGWRMLMEQLAGGRAVSLPAGAVGSMKHTAQVTGAYSMVRRQFGIPIGLMEGVQAKVAHIAAMTYLFEAARVFTCSAIDHGEKPPIVSALLKATTTEYAQRLAIDAMDVFAGSGVMQGPNNLISGAYTGAPVSVTVEGANIMTRTLLVFGQGATRCHPYALNLVNAVEANDVDAFRTNLLGWFKHTLVNWVRSKVLGLTRGLFIRRPVKGATAKHYRRLAWASARFALLADLAMYFIGGKLKARGNLSGRLADALSWQVLAMATLRRFEAEGRREEDLPLVHYASEYAFEQIQHAFDGIHANFDVPVIGWWLKYPGSIFLRLNPLTRGPSDDLIALTAATIQQPGAQYDRLIEGIVTPAKNGMGADRLARAFQLNFETAALQRTLRKFDRDDQEDSIKAALDAGEISEADANKLREAEEAVQAAWLVDQFAPTDYFGV